MEGLPGATEDYFRLSRGHGKPVRTDKGRPMDNRSPTL